jgi:hypothetical protein
VNMTVSLIWEIGTLCMKRMTEKEEGSYTSQETGRQSRCEGARERGTLIYYVSI